MKIKSFETFVISTERLKALKGLRYFTLTALQGVVIPTKIHKRIL